MTRTEAVSAYGAENVDRLVAAGMIALDEGVGTVDPVSVGEAAPSSLTAQDFSHALAAETAALGATTVITSPLVAQPVKQLSSTLVDDSLSATEADKILAAAGLAAVPDSENTMADRQDTSATPLEIAGTVLGVTIGVLATAFAVITVTGVMQNFAADHLDEASGIFAKVLRFWATSGSLAHRKYKKHLCPVVTSTLSEPADWVKCVDMFDRIALDQAIYSITEQRILRVADWDLTKKFGFVINVNGEDFQLMYRSSATLNATFAFHRVDNQGLQNDLFRMVTQEELMNLEFTSEARSK